MTREKALELLHKHMQNQNLRRHCYAVEATMRALYNRLEDGEKSQAEEDKAFFLIDLQVYRFVVRLGTK